MCESCENGDGEKGGVSRRVFLGAAAMAAGAGAVGLWSCVSEGKKNGGQWLAVR